MYADFKIGQRIKWTGRSGKERTGVIREVCIYDLGVNEERFHARTGKPLETKQARVWKKNATIIGDTSGA